MEPVPGRQMISIADDLQALIRTSQALSREIVLDRLIDQLTVKAVEHAGAVRGVVLLLRDGEMRVVAEAVIRDEVLQLVEHTAASTPFELPDSVLNLVMTTHEAVTVEDAREPNPHASDPYFINAAARSVLCLPLVAQHGLTGAIYLENDLASHVFTAHTLFVLQLLASQAAISIENAIVFQRLQRAEAEARQACGALRQEFDLIPVQVWRTDANGVLEAANKQWYDFTGLTQEEAADYQKTCHPDDRERVFGLWRDILQSGVPGEVECRMRRFDGKYRSVLARASPLRDETGAIIRWHGTSIDIEDLKRAEQAQEALARISRVTAMGEFAVSIAHEVSQPLMAIVTNAAACLQWLTGQPANVAKARLAAERVVRDGHRAGEVLGGIRALAQNAPPVFAEIDVNDVIVEVLTLARHKVERHGIVVKTSLAAGRCSALGDHVQIQQVVLNLIVNAIEAMVGEEGRILSVSTERTDAAFILVSISDSGHGLGPEQAARVFDAFYTTKVGGVGMGLSICRSIIENHGGRMTLSPNLPRGCAFSFQLPVFTEGRPLVHIA